MENWTSGYVSDIDYTYGYYQELNPLRANLALTVNGILAPEIKFACELGFGQGISTNFHAILPDVEWYGTDFNPAQAGFAQELAKGADAKINLFDQSFAEFCSRDDLPNFDFIGLHGIWSWISDANRKILVDFVRRKLSVGGVIYLGYNTLPGWSPFQPLRRLMAQHTYSISGAGENLTTRMQRSINFAKKMMETNPSFARAVNGVTDRLNVMSTQSPNYLAHEYFNQDWEPMLFAELVESLKPTKAEFAASGSLLDLFDAINLTDEQRQFLHKIDDPYFKQSVRDFLVNQFFRRDYWVKGKRKLSDSEKSSRIREQEFVLLVDVADIPLKVQGGQGEVELNKSVFEPVLEALSDNKHFTIQGLMNIEKVKALGLSQVTEVILILASNGNVAPALSSEKVPKAKERAVKLNDFLIDRARFDGKVGLLVSPLTASGIGVSRFQKLFISAMKSGYSSPEELARAVWQLLEAQNEKILKDGKALESEDDNLRELLLQARDFKEKKLPMLKTALIA